MASQDLSYTKISQLIETNTINDNSVFIVNVNNITYKIKFSTLRDAIDDTIESDITALTTRVATLESTVTTLATTVSDLAGTVNNIITAGFNLIGIDPAPSNNGN